MQTISYEDVATSKPFRFLVGPHKREFTIHSALVAIQSPALNRLIHGDFKEAQEHHADLESVDEDTFIRFVEYAYTGQYHARAALPPKSPELVDDWGSGTTTKKKKKGSASRNEELAELRFPANMWDKFMRAVSALDVLVPKEPYLIITSGPVHNGSATNIFLSHAKTFVFAECWGISRLAGISIQELANALKDLRFTDTCIDDIVALLEYCYDDARPEKLTSLVLLYTASKAETLWTSERFRNFFARNQELSVSFLGAMLAKD